MNPPTPHDLRPLDQRGALWRELLCEVLGPIVIFSGVGALLALQRICEAL